MTLAQQCHIEPGVWHIPAGCVEVAPPVSEGLTPRWDGVQWSLQLKPADPEPETDPVVLLTQFLANNPSVAALLNGAQPN
ncbi:MAG: phage tail protein [Leptothrix sp. (in: b-proteobacteria)]